MGQHPWRCLRLGIKRVIDIVVAGGLLFVLFPAYVAIYLIVRFKMGQPAIFTQVRPGLDGRLFIVHKFRTMMVATTDVEGHLLGDAERTPKLGHFLRKTSLDELPQLISVLRGDMSLIGPRPLLMEYLDQYSPEQARRHQMRPGITGWAQVNGRNHTRFSERFRLDVWYIDHWSLTLDAKILWRTVRYVTHGSGVITGQNVMTVDDVGFNKPQGKTEETIA